ncbi:MAG: single-stranded DNA-binding protein [Bacteroidia bacterium]|nr:single-stranded DNA-binding protein [Bacteroidia bacterium]
MSQPAASIVRIARALSRELEALHPPSSLAFTYDPIEYAWSAHRAYCLMARARPRALFVGMNPGPFGMVQTGVPFGEVGAVQGFLGIDERITPPAHQHPRRPIEGFACSRSEVSGRRFWGLMRDAFGTRATFFQSAFVWNWCPLAFLSSSGANVTPDKLPASVRGAIEAACDCALVRIVRALEPRMVIGVGGFARDRAIGALPAGTAVHTVLHPSPASPAANRGWERQARAQLVACGFLDPAS